LSFGIAGGHEKLAHVGSAVQQSYAKHFENLHDTAAAFGFKAKPDAQR
jgi:hypothetical protein